MQNTIALVESKTFWAALLALIAVVAQQFGFAQAVGIASDPATVNTILNGVAMIGAVGAILFRGVANAKVTSVLPPGSASKTSAHGWLAIPLFALLALGGAFGLSGCVSQAEVDEARAAYAAAFLAPAAHYRQLGYCATGTKATLAHLCAERAVVAKLRAADDAVAAAVANVQSQMIAGRATDLGVLAAAVAAAESLVAANVTPLGVR